MSAWISHVKDYAKKHGVTYKEAMSGARSSYRMVGGVRDLPSRAEERAQLQASAPRLQQRARAHEERMAVAEATRVGPQRAMPIYSSDYDQFPEATIGPVLSRMEREIIAGLIEEGKYLKSIGVLSTRQGLRDFKEKIVANTKKAKRMQLYNMIRDEVVF